MDILGKTNYERDHSEFMEKSAHWIFVFGLNLLVHEQFFKIRRFPSAIPASLVDMMSLLEYGVENSRTRSRMMCSSCSAEISESKETRLVPGPT